MISVHDDDDADADDDDEIVPLLCPSPRFFQSVLFSAHCGLTLSSFLRCSESSLLRSKRQGNVLEKYKGLPKIHWFCMFYSLESEI